MFYIQILTLWCLGEPGGLRRTGHARARETEWLGESVLSFHPMGPEGLTHIIGFDSATHLDAKPAHMTSFVFLFVCLFGLVLKHGLVQAGLKLTTSLP